MNAAIVEIFPARVLAPFIAARCKVRANAGKYIKPPPLNVSRIHALFVRNPWRVEIPRTFTTAPMSCVNRHKLPKTFCTIAYASLLNWVICFYISRLHPKVSEKGLLSMSFTFFLNEEQVQTIAKEFGTPVYVYDEKRLHEQAQNALRFPVPYGLTVRFAMKACPNAEILRIFHRLGLYMDASSGYEVVRALRAGIPPHHIQLTAQELPEDLRTFVDKGVWFNASSLHQLKTYGKMFPDSEVSVRVNPGLGSGHSNRTNVGGPSSSFGIWHEFLPEVVRIAERFRLKITRMHTHIGSGADPEVWVRCARLALDAAAVLPTVTRLSLGGGFKVARMPHEQQADLDEIGRRVAVEVKNFSRKHRRKLHIEIEPGTYLVAHAGVIICRVIDIVNTGKGGYHFIKVNTGMTEILRPSLYGAQHPIQLVPARQRKIREKEKPFVVVGHCCESGDILTPEPGNPEGIAPRLLPTPRIGDYLVIGATGAYCAAMPAKNYNSFPEAPEVLVEKTGAFKLIRTRQTVEDMLKNEIVDARN